MRRTALALTAGLLLAGTPALAAALPVGVTYDTEDGVSVGTSVGGQPGVGASVRDGYACAGASYQVPQCVELPETTTR